MSEDVQDLLNRFAATKELVQGKFRTSTTEAQFVYRPNLERIHRQTLTILRKEIKPSSLPDFTSFLFHWQRLHPSTRATSVLEIIEQMQAFPLPAEIWEREILWRRLKHYTADATTAITASGQVVWTGAGAGKMRCILRGEAAAFLPQTVEVQLFAEPSKRILKYLRDNGASFLHDIRGGTHLALDALNNGLAELFWKGVVTNDVFAELLSVKRALKATEEMPIEPIDMLTGRRNPHRFKAMRSVRRALKQVPGWNGRWSLVHLPSVMGDELSLQERIEAQTTLLLNRYGILARELFRREEMLPWQLIASQLQQMEMRGEIRRGYFVEGLSGMQFALPAAVEELRRVRSDQGPDELPVLINACDPANPFGQGIRFETNTLVRIPPNYIAFHQGTPVLFVEGNGARLQTAGSPSSDVLRSALGAFIGMLKLPDHLRPFKEIIIENCDAERAAASSLTATLLSLGFRRDMNQTMRYDGY